MIKAVFFDVDGTFYDHTTNQVFPETLLAVKRLKEQGYKVALCSGRALVMSQQLGLIDLFDWDGYIGSAGVSVYNEHMDLIFEDGFTYSQSKQIFEIAKLHNICVQSHGTYEFMTMPMNDYARVIFQQFHMDDQGIEIRDWKGENMTTLCAYEKKGFDWSIFSHIEGIKILQPCETAIDFFRSDTSKAKGISKLMKYWGFPPQEYMAFGDSMNDLEMIQNAEMGIVMGNGHPDLKPFAAKVIGPSFEPSIYQYLCDIHMI